MTILWENWNEDIQLDLQIFWFLVFKGPWGGLDMTKVMAVTKPNSFKQWLRAEPRNFLGCSRIPNFAVKSMLLCELLCEGLYQLYTLKEPTDRREISRGSDRSRRSYTMSMCDTYQPRSSHSSGLHYAAHGRFRPSNGPLSTVHTLRYLLFQYVLTG